LRKMNEAIGTGIQQGEIVGVYAVVGSAQFSQLDLGGLEGIAEQRRFEGGESAGIFIRDNEHFGAGGTVVTGRIGEEGVQFLISAIMPGSSK